MKTDIATLTKIYEGSNGDDTAALYRHLETFGPAGKVAVNLFRAHKASARAKVYRGGVRGQGSYRGMAYGRKDWALDNLCQALAANAGTLGIAWGWGVDEARDAHRDVLYIELPTGQVSFHSARRMNGPDFIGRWDGIKNAGAGRIISWIVRVTNQPAARP